MRVGRGSDEIDQLGSLAGAVTPKPPVNAEKAKRYQRTDQQTDRPSDRGEPLIRPKIVVGTKTR